MCRTYIPQWTSIGCHDHDDDDEEWHGLVFIMVQHYSVLMSRFSISVRNPKVIRIVITL